MLSLLLVSFSSCSEYEDKMPPIKVGAAPWIGYEPLFLARELGIYDSDRIKLVELLSSTETLNLLREGMLDVAALTLDEALMAIEEGMTIEVILVMDSSNGADVLLASPHFETMKSLQGHKVGVENNAVGAFLLQSALTASGMKLQDIKVVPLQGEQILSAFNTHKVDAVVTYNPKSILLQKQGAKRLFDSKQIPNKIIDVLVVRADGNKQKMSRIQDLVSGYFKALDFFKDSPKKAMAIMLPRLHLEVEDLEGAFQGVRLLDRVENQKLFKNKAQELQLLAQELQSILLEKGLLNKPRDIHKIFNTQLF